MCHEDVYHGAEFDEGGFRDLPVFCLFVFASGITLELTYCVQHIRKRRGEILGNESAIRGDKLFGHHTHTHQCEWHRMTRMTGPDCAVMCNLINTHTHTHTHKYH